MKLIQKYFLFLLNLIIMASLCFSGQYSVFAQSQTQVSIESVSPPLFPDLTWKNLGNIQKDVHVYGQIVTLSGDMFESIENFNIEIPEDVFNYYSIKNLESLGWKFVGNESFESAYWHPSGRYLIVQIMECPDSETDYCVNVWQSADSNNTPPVAQSLTAPINTLVAFSKTNPTNGSTIPLPGSTFHLLEWGDAQIGSTDRYQYCIDETNNQNCDSDNWLTRNSLYSGPDFTVLSGHTYYWQVRVRDAGISANGGTWWSFTVQANYPTVSSIVRANPVGPITAASSVSFTVNFSEAVTGVDVADFTLTPIGVSGAGVSGIVGSGNVYTVTVNTGTGDGSIRLDVTDNDTIINSTSNKLGGVGAGNGNFTSGQSYIIDHALPTVVSSVRANPSPTSDPSNNFIVTLSEPVTGVDKTDFTLIKTGTPIAFISAVSGSGSIYTVTVKSRGSGTIRLDVADNDTIVDLALNPLGGIGVANGDFTAGEIYTVNNSGGDTTGVFRPSNGLLFLKNTNTAGFADLSINYGNTGDFPVTGDWDGNGTDTIGIYRNGVFYLRNSNTIGFADIVFAFGAPGDQPVVGDWNGDGIDTIGLYRGSTITFSLRNSNSAGAPDISFLLGTLGDVGIAGDWNGDGVDTTGVFRPGNGVIFLKNANTSGVADIALNYGLPGDLPVTGDWNDDGVDTIGVYRNGQLLLRNSNTIGFADLVFALGNLGDMAIAGNWDGIP